MANYKKQQPKKAENNNTQPMKTVNKKYEKKEPSKQEIMFYRIGLIVITMTLVVATVIMLVTYFMDKDAETKPYTDEMQITETDLVHLMINDPLLGYVVDQDYFTKYANYLTWRSLINNNNIIYVYFYKSSDYNVETETTIETKNLEGLAFFFLDLDNFPKLFENVNLLHLDLNKESKEMLLIYNTVEQNFEILDTSGSILITINELS